MLTYILAGISCIGGAGNWSQNGQVTIMARGPNLGTSPLQSIYAGSIRLHSSPPSSHTCARCCSQNRNLSILDPGSSANNDDA